MSAYENGYVRVPCDCGCATLEFSRTDWGDGEIGYDACILDSYYDHKATGVMARIRRALMALVGKPLYYNDVSMTEEEFDVLIAQLEALRKEDR